MTRALIFTQATAKVVIHHVQDDVYHSCADTLDMPTQNLKCPLSFLTSKMYVPPTHTLLQHQDDQHYVALPNSEVVVKYRMIQRSKIEQCDPD